MYRQQRIQQQPPSRRNLLILLGFLGAGTASCIGGGLIGGLILLLRPSKKNEVVYVTETPQSITAPAIVKTTIPEPDIISREAWGALAPNHDATYEDGFYNADNPEGWRVYDMALEDAYQTVVIHHSVIYEADDDETMLEIQRFHREEREWADVAYHFFVGKSGAIYQGRDWSVRGTHVGGYNTGSLGICLLGNFMNQNPTDAQINSTNQLLAWLVFRLKLTHLAGHQDFNPDTLCPGDNLVAYLDSFATNHGLGHGIDGYKPPADATPTPQNIGCACPQCNSVV